MDPKVADVTSSHHRTEGWWEKMMRSTPPPRLFEDGVATIGTHSLRVAGKFAIERGLQLVFRTGNRWLHVWVGQT